MKYIVLAFSALIIGCGTKPDPKWGPSPAYQAPKTHKPWGDNWTRDTQP